ncbi:MAG: peptidoglycan DD-metalloendopeptidase family protein [Bacteroidota bacterium]
MNKLLLLLALLTSSIGFGQPTDLAPSGGGEVAVSAHQHQHQDRCLSTEDRHAIKAKLATNVDRLLRQGVLSGAANRDPVTVKFDLPMANANGNTFHNAWYITNYVDHDLTYSGVQYGATNLDYNCGNRTYDNSDGYNHQGIDYASWPFPWYQYENNLLNVVAAADGTIIGKDDGQDDDHCSCSGSWNAVYVRHADGSEAWYGHLKKHTLTTKAVGQTVSAGEVLGVVASSGCSTDPHLHFEVYDSGSNLIDPYGGACNSMNGTTSWWNVQRDYKPPAICATLTHSAPPSFGCPTVNETPNIETTFQAGSTIHFANYYRYQAEDDLSFMQIKRPDNTVWDSWIHDSPSSYNTSYWYWSRTLPNNGPSGTWTYEVEYLGKTYTSTFTYMAALPVELTAFSAQKHQSTQALLEWTTATETDNAGFEVQRSFDGKTWEALGFVEGQGTSEQTQHYRFIDPQPFRTINYYRLRQIDYNGTFEFSAIKTVEIDQLDNGITVFPNPVQGELTILAEDIQVVKVFDTQGRLSMQFVGPSVVDFSNLPKGIYLLKVETSTQSYTEKVVKR